MKKETLETVVKIIKARAIDVDTIWKGKCYVIVSYDKPNGSGAFICKPFENANLEKDVNRVRISVFEHKRGIREKVENYKIEG